jgi:hypothetical protein
VAKEVMSGPEHMIFLIEDRVIAEGFGFTKAFTRMAGTNSHNA